MNHRIRELVKQAVLDVDVVTGDKTLDDELSKMYIPDRFAEKFAELIIEDCRDVMLEVYHLTPLELCWPLMVADEEIMKHFYGVKE